MTIGDFAPTGAIFTQNYRKKGSPSTIHHLRKLD